MLRLYLSPDHCVLSIGLYLYFECRRIAGFLMLKAMANLCAFLRAGNVIINGWRVHHHGEEDEEKRRLINVVPSGALAISYGDDLLYGVQRY